MRDQRVDELGLNELQVLKEITAQVNGLQLIIQICTYVLAQINGLAATSTFSFWTI